MFNFMSVKKPGLRQGGFQNIRLLRIGPFIAIFAMVSGPVHAETDTLPTLKQFTATGGAVDVTMTLRRASGTTHIGNFDVDQLLTLSVCEASNSANCSDPYAGAVLKLGTTDTLKTSNCSPGWQSGLI